MEESLRSEYFTEYYIYVQRNILICLSLLPNKFHDHEIKEIIQLAKTLIICLKHISEEGFLLRFNSNVQIINTSLTFLKKEAIQNAKFNVNRNQNHLTNHKSFSNRRSDFASKLILQIFATIFVYFPYI